MLLGIGKVSLFFFFPSPKEIFVHEHKYLLNKQRNKTTKEKRKEKKGRQRERESKIIFLLSWAPVLEMHMGYLLIDLTSQLSKTFLILLLQ